MTVLARPTNVIQPLNELLNFPFILIQNIHFSNSYHPSKVLQNSWVPPEILDFNTKKKKSVISFYFNHMQTINCSSKKKLSAPILICWGGERKIWKIYSLFCFFSCLCFCFCLHGERCGKQLTPLQHIVCHTLKDVFLLTTWFQSQFGLW